VNEFLAFADITDLAPMHRVAYPACWYSSTVLAGGHPDYVLNSNFDCGDETVAALRTMGAKAQADILVAAKRAVSEAMHRAPQQDANRFLAGVESADLTEFDDALEPCRPSIPDGLRENLDSHDTGFIEWKP
jgi:hypothetical protein